MRSYLYLSNGEVFPGTSLSYHGEVAGDLLLYSSPSFRFQILTDPACLGKIVVADSDTIEDRRPMVSEIESFSPHLNVLVISGKLRPPRAHDNAHDLVNYLASNLIALFLPDQPDRLLTAIRHSGRLQATLTTVARDVREIATNDGQWRATSMPCRRPVGTGRDPIRALSTSLEFIWDMPEQRTYDGKVLEKKYVVVAYDFGLSYSLLRNLTRFGCDIRVVPVDYSPEAVIALKPEGILLAGGPGEPESMGYAISRIGRLVGLRPILATGLGHVLLGLSMGAEAVALEQPHFGADILVEEFGKRSRSAPFRTIQTHGVCLKADSLGKAGFRVSLANSRDKSVEGYENLEFLIQAYAFNLGGEDNHTFAFIRKFVSCMEAHRATEGPRRQARSATL